jgi:hypothetical protein
MKPGANDATNLQKQTKRTTRFFPFVSFVAFCENATGSADSGLGGVV